MNNHNICFRGEIRKILCGYLLLSVAMVNDFSRQQFRIFFLHVIAKIGFDISCKFSAEKAVSMKCPTLFSEGERKKKQQHLFVEEKLTATKEKVANFSLLAVTLA